MRGLYGKHSVVRTSTGQTLPEGTYFVLVPAKDPAARVALAAYAEATDNATLAQDIQHWLEQLRMERTVPAGALAVGGRHARPEGQM